LRGNGAPNMSQSNTIQKSFSQPPDIPSSCEDFLFDSANGYLYVDFRNSCNTCLRISTWEQGLVISRWNATINTWEQEETDPGLPFCFDDNNPRAIPAINSFMQYIPKELRICLKPFMWRQMVLLKMVRHDARAMIDLVQSNPALALLFADRVAEKEVPIYDAVKLAGRKRRFILEFAGGPCTESAVKILSRIRPDESLTKNDDPQSRYFTQNTCKELRKVVYNHSLMYRLRHIRKIPIGFLRYLVEKTDLSLWLLKIHYPGTAIAGQELFETIVSLFRIWNDIVAMGNYIGGAAPVSRIMKLHDVRQLKKLHDTWADHVINKTEVSVINTCKQKYGTTQFPKPPIAGTDAIIPIETIEELFAESRRMHNCAASYAERIMEGKCYLYRVLKPERATLEIKEEDGIFFPVQLKAACNLDVGEGTKEIVEEWVRNAKKTEK